MTTCVIGLGKIGLPLAVQIASKGERVIGADINENVVSLINEGKPPFPGEKERRNTEDEVFHKRIPRRALCASECP